MVDGWSKVIYYPFLSQSEATLKIRVSGEAKKSFEVPINKADSRFFKFAFRGDETGDEQVFFNLLQSAQSLIFIAGYCVNCECGEWNQVCDADFNSHLQELLPTCSQYLAGGQEQVKHKS